MWPKELNLQFCNLVVKKKDAFVNLLMKEKYRIFEFFVNHVNLFCLMELFSRKRTKRNTDDFTKMLRIYMLGTKYHQRKL